jgi:hypothetical protein
VELRRFAAQLLDVRERGVRLQQRVIDHRRDGAGRTGGGVHAQARCAGIDHAAQPVRTTVSGRGMTGAALPGTAAQPLRGEHLVGDDVNQTLEIL